MIASDCLCNPSCEITRGVLAVCPSACVSERIRQWFLYVFSVSKMSVMLLMMFVKVSISSVFPPTPATSASENRYVVLRSLRMAANLDS